MGKLLTANVAPGLLPHVHRYKSRALWHFKANISAGHLGNSTENHGQGGSRLPINGSIC